MTRPPSIRSSFGAGFDLADGAGLFVFLQRFFVDSTVGSAIKG
jgi:hypothetical protein